MIDQMLHTFNAWAPEFRAGAAGANEGGTHA
jgi:hypothetical protein